MNCCASCPAAATAYVEAVSTMVRITAQSLRLILGVFLIDFLRETLFWPRTCFAHRVTSCDDGP